MLVQFGHFESAQTLLESALQRDETEGPLEEGAEGIRALNVARVLRQLGVVARRRGNMSDALRYYERAHLLLDALALLQSPEGLELTINLGNAQVQVQQSEAGLDTLLKAKSIATAMERLNTL